MAAVVNVLRFKDRVAPELFARPERELTPQVVQTAETEVVLVILGDDVDVLDRIATEIGSPWMVTNVVPLLSTPPERHIDPTIATSRRT